ncbi:MAG: YggS family pyridoxal phosphate-dependent enzyme [Ruminococcaceae bacterium]|nr:YggS family pyridoxal phosphate-dependent enzyme [Oscillospiraceae bacterium]
METSTEARSFDFDTISANVEAARRQIADLAPDRQVKLLAVTKTVPADVINYAIDHLGITAIGENRVQELLEKYDSLHTPPGRDKLEIHLIGSLQTNKVKYIIDKVDMIESVDSVKLAAEIDRQAKKHGLIMDILVEVNIGREPQKGGVMPEELASFLGELAHLSSLRLRGLMTIAPKCDEKSDYLKFFAETFQLFLDISQNIAHNNSMAQFDVLSMGMSGSYPEALQCGSTEIRLGSTIFGARA